jgi:SNF2 family DNA or RNA helicase
MPYWPVILTTYGTLRRDALHLRDVEFDYVVLDEAQAVKNSRSESAKAVRLLRAGHRLALSGTPVENHLGELWSLSSFSTRACSERPGFKLAGGAARDSDKEARRLLAQALRPSILRRRRRWPPNYHPKASRPIAKWSAPSASSTTSCASTTATRCSSALRSRVWRSPKSRFSKRYCLRQAACRPGLLDAKRSGEPSAKLDVLLEQLREVRDEGHKALVLSQFTSLLRIVRDRLECSGVAYEYLDGDTRDRQARVERFQNDTDCRLFLISLKAGGLGLNLTAAEYVFLLDPWWNPAVEAQAVDRAHRIGQTRQVLAYRLIARDTVERRFSKLQKTKRDLAAAIISADNSLIRNLLPEDLELLLS